jgi:hypothetical protein
MRVKRQKVHIQKDRVEKEKDLTFLMMLARKTSNTRRKVQSRRTLNSLIGLYIPIFYFIFGKKRLRKRRQSPPHRGEGAKNIYWKIWLHKENKKIVSSRNQIF